MKFVNKMIVVYFIGWFLLTILFINWSGWFIGLSAALPSGAITLGVILIFRKYILNVINKYSEQKYDLYVIKEEEN